MTTFGTMQQRIRDEMNRDGLTGDIKDSIRSSISYYESDRFFFNEFSASASTTTGDPYVTPPAATLEVDLVIKKVSGSKTPMTERNFLEVESYAEATSEPNVYAKFSDKLRFYPVPDAVYEINLFGKQKLTDISADATSADTNSWMTDGEALIRSKAKEALYRHKLRNTEEANKMEREAEREWVRLKKKTQDKVGSGKLMPYRF